jgi:hypothetical protein
MKSRVAQIVGLLAALLLILLLATREPSTGSKTPTTLNPEDFESAERQTPAPADLTREAADPDADLLASPVLFEERGRIVTDVGEPAGTGKLLFANAGTVHAVEVLGGYFSDIEPIRGIRALAEADPTIFRFCHSTGSISKIVAYHPVVGDQAGYELVLPSACTIHVQVQDLAGKPVSGAMLKSFDSAPTEMPTHCITDGTGFAAITLFPASPDVQIQVRAAGYLQESVVVNVSQDKDVRIALKRVLAAGLVRDRRAPSTMMALAMDKQLNDSPVVSAYDYREVLDRRAAEFQLAEHEEPFWVVSCETDRWVEAVATASARDQANARFGPARIPMKQITDPDLELHRPTWPLVRDHDCVLNLRFRPHFTTADESWPIKTGFYVEGIRSSDAQPVSRTYFASRTGPGEYKCYLPAGTFRLETAHDEALLDAGAAATFEPTVEFSTSPHEAAQLDVPLSGDCALIAFHLRTHDGIPAILQAAVMPHNAWPIIPANHGSTFARFVKVGSQYKLIAVPITPAPASVLLDKLVATEEVLASGRWTLTVPERDPSTGNRLWLR